MADRAIPDIHQQIAAAFEWWRDAGVDCDFIDEPKNWIAVNSPVAEDQPQARPLLQKRQAAPPPDPTIALSAIPGDLSGFVDWWMSEPLLDAGRVSDRVPPRGNAGAELMVIVAHPEADDREGLLSGPEGRLLSSMLQAMGIAPETTYVASALPRHTPHADWAAASMAGLGTALLRHIELVAPRRIIVFGSNILPLLGHDLPKSPADLRKVNHEVVKSALMVARELGALLGRASWKAGFWQRWLEWTRAGAVGE
jgi:uracil-DNA glycosylase family 4